VSDRFHKTILNYVVLRDIGADPTPNIERLRLMVMACAASRGLVRLLRNNSLTHLITHEFLRF
jgi:hypothetical protein